MISFQGSLFLKMSQESTAPQVVEISGSSSIRWPNAGQWTLVGEQSTLNTGFLNEDVGCLLSPVSHPSLKDILQANVPRKYFLSPRAAAGILRRAEKRGRELPLPLEAALKDLASTWQEEAEKTT